VEQVALNRHVSPLHAAFSLMTGNTPLVKGHAIEPIRGRLLLLMARRGSFPTTGPVPSGPFRHRWPLPAAL